MSLMSEKAIGGIYIRKEWRAENLQPVIEFEIFRFWLERSILQRIFWLNSLFFVVMIGVF
jgi:hypothetical protein